MLRMRKCVISVLLAGIVCVAAISSGSTIVCAEEQETESIELKDYEKSGDYSDYEYEVQEDDTVKIIKYIGTAETLSIPSQIDGKDVTAINGLASPSCKNLTSVRIPETVTELRLASVSDFSGLTSIEVDESNPNYASYDGILYEKDMKELLCCPRGRKGNVKIPGSVTEIGGNAFSGCQNLTGVEIPTSVTWIGAYAFQGCESLNHIELPESVKVIEYDVFGGCDITSIKIPKSVEDLDSTFRGCKSLTSIVVDESNPNYASYDGMLFNKDMTKLISCPGGRIEDVKIPESVTQIGIEAFMSCKNLTSIEIPESVTEIGDWAFYGCDNLARVNIPKDLKYIYRRSFYVCKNLVSVEIPEGVAYIGEGAFWNCSSLSCVKIPASVTDIEKTAFSYCDKNMVFWVAPDSYAETFAKDNNIRYRYFGEECTHTYTSKFLVKPTCTAGGEEICICTECGDSYTKAAPAGHTVVKDHAVAATCKEEGKTQGSHCSVCKEVFVKQEIIPASHSYQTTVGMRAGIDRDGSIVQWCTRCREVKDETTIYAVKTIELSKTTFAYNKKSQRPSVTVKDSKGKVLKAGTDYTVSYPEDTKNIGKYTVTIQFQGNYLGWEFKDFTIAPKGTAISKVTAKKKGFTVKWKKQADQTTGYEIAYSTDSKFGKKAAKAVTVGKNKTVSKTVSKLKAKKKYYVRIRTYKTVKVSGKSTKIYSSWSRAKTVTTKK